MAVLVVRDETMVGRTIDEWELPDLTDQVTARELVRLRVREEVARFRAAPAGTFRGPLRPDDDQLSWEEQADLAVAGFARDAFVMIAGSRRVEDLDEVIDLDRARSVSFIRLKPPVGG